MRRTVFDLGHSPMHITKDMLKGGVHDLFTPLAAPIAIIWQRPDRI